jgi:hypothetical protein
MRACAILSAPLLYFGTITASASAEGNTAVSHIIGPNVVLGEFGQSGTTLIVDHVNVIANKRNFLAAYVVYNSQTCQELDEGAWTVGTKPRKGHFSFRNVTAHLSNGACPNTTFTFAGIFYTWTAAVGVKDVGAATWKGTQCSVNCVAPYKFVFHLEQ